MSQIKQYAIETIRQEEAAVAHLAEVLSSTDDLEKSVEAILACKGKVVVTGLGKSGHVGRKIAATLASTGTPAFFVHPAEAYHGDFGMISPADIVLAITNSGETTEVAGMIPFIKRQGNVLISITCNPESTLARNSNFHLNTDVRKEACPLNAAPTNSSTVSLVMGDALAMALMRVRGFTKSDFVIFHPGGALGKTLSKTKK